MAKAPNTAAREYLTPSEQSALEAYGITSAEFDRVRQEDRAPDMEAANDPPSGSQMVKESQPRLEPRPPKELAKEVDREAFADRWAEELERARDEAPEQDKDHEHAPEISR